MFGSRPSEGPRFEQLEPRVLLSAALPADEPVHFPPGSAVVNVTNWSNDPAAVATPDDGVDDTAALQGILDTFARDNRVIYLPDGRYDLSGTLHFRGVGNNVAARTYLQGESRDGTVLRLADGIDLDGPVLQTGTGVAQHFRNSVRNLTIDVGAGNPEAVGLAFYASNQGTASDVLIRADAGSGRIGLDLGFSDEIGPLLVEDVEVRGYGIGVRSQLQTNSKVISGLTVRDQESVGVLNHNSGVLVIEDLHSINQVPAIDNGVYTDPSKPGNGRLTVVGAVLEGVGQAAGEAAIYVGGDGDKPRLYLRDIEVSGYGQSLFNLNDLTSNPDKQVGNAATPTGDVEEYWFNGVSAKRRGGTFELFDNTPDATLGLQRLDTPGYASVPPSQWAGLTEFGGVADDGEDDTAALQAAIDSGASTVFLDRGVWQVDGTVELRGSVDRVLGLGGRLTSASGVGEIRLADGSADAVTVERLEVIDTGSTDPVPFVHASGRAWSFASVLGFAYAPEAGLSAPGDLFLADVATINDAATQLVFRDQRVRATQLNVEIKSGRTDAGLLDSMILNDGADFRVVGLKVEKPGTILETRNGGRSEVLGAYFNGSGKSGPEDPAFVTIDSALSLSQLSFPPGTPYERLASETRGGVTRTTSTFDNAEVDSAFDAATLWDIRGTVVLDEADTANVTRGTGWSSSTPFNGGFIGEEVRAASAVGSEYVFTPTLPDAGTYELSLRWTNNPGGADNQASNAPVEVTLADGTVQLVRVNQSAAGSGGRWQSLGTFELDPVTAEVRLFVDAATDGRVIADGLRLVLIDESSAEPEVPGDPEPAATPTAIGSINRGVGTDDASTGTAYIMYSDQNVRRRFSPRPIRDNASNLVAVQFRDGQWHYDNNSGFHNTFEIADGDLLLAKLDLDADTVTSLEGQIGTFEGIRLGYAAGDLAYFADQWNGSFKNGKQDVTGTEFTRWTDESFAGGGGDDGEPGDDDGDDTGGDNGGDTGGDDGGDAGGVEVAIGSINKGIGTDDDSTGTGFIMYSERNVRSRFSPRPIRDNASNLIAVSFRDGQWFYDNNTGFENTFTPEAGDLLLAAIDLDNDTVDSLIGTSGLVEGIESSYASGNLSFFADQWNGKTKNGKFDVTGSRFFRNDAVV